jgi:hypothetical protein
MHPNSLEILASALVFDSRDWTATYGDVWIYGIVVGWEESMLVQLTRKYPQLAEKGRLDYMRKLHKDYGDRCSS